MDQDIRRIGSRLEPFVDDWLIDRFEGVDLRLHAPQAREVVMTFEKPWEGNTSAYFTVFRDEGRIRMYYRGSDFDWETRESTHQVACYAESEDGIHWDKPELGICEFQGSRRNNIILTGVGSHNFAPFKDTNAACSPDLRYKALGGDSKGLIAFGSPDGVHWSKIQEEPVITKGAFDSQNLAFWDAETGVYRDFHRGSRNGCRDIMTCTSEDFVHWTEPEYLDFGEAPIEHLYTNAVTPYFRAPHVYMGFPKRFLPKRKKVDEHPLNGLSDGVFMSSRDGLHWHRWIEAFIRPGPQRERWWERNNMTAWGMIKSRSEIDGTPDVISLYSSESYYVDGLRLRRYTLRQDGFVSVHADYPGGEFVTHPLVFDGDDLLLNYSTSAAGSIRAEVLNADGSAARGFGLEECREIYGDEIEGRVEWGPGTSLGHLAGTPIRLRFALKDADLYSLRFS